MKLRTSLLVIALLCLAGTVMAQQEQPKVLEHWSPYDYPTSFPPDARGYIIVKGDTLWDISERFYSNPLLWPQIYAANSYIGDPHWIYPGDPLVLPGLAVAEPGRVAGEQAQAEPSEQPAGEEESATEAGQPTRTGEQETAEGMPANFDESVYFETEPRASLKYKSAAGDIDLYCSVVVYPQKIDTNVWVADKEEAGATEIYDTDIVYLNAGRDVVKAGDLMIAANRIRSVKHPLNNEYVGEAYQEVGLVRVIIAAEDHAIAEVLEACDGLRVGTVLTPYEMRPSPITPVRITMPAIEQYHLRDDDLVGTIVYSNYEVLEIGTYEPVAIDLGSEDGLRIGDRLYVFRTSTFSREHDDYPESEITGTATARRFFGELVVYRVFSTTCCAIPLYLADVTNVGDRVTPIEQR